MDTPLLVFLHGPGQSPPVWQDVVGAINPEQPMAAPWLKGLKPSEHEGFHMEQAVAAVVDLMETRGAERADLVGYSLGGLVAVRTALAYPDKIAHLVLISTPAVLGRTLISSQRMIAKLTPARMFKGVGKEQVLAALDAMLEADITADLAKLTTPVLAIIAENDTAGLASMEQMAHDAHATTRQLPGSDPNLLATHPAVLARLISDFCADFLDDDTPANPA